MASSTPPPHCSLTSSTRPSHFHHHQPPQIHHNHHTTWTPQRFSLNHNNNSNYASPRPSLLSRPDFSATRSTRSVSKRHYGRTRSAPPGRHSAAAEQVLSLSDLNNNQSMDSILLSFESKLFASDDYTFLLRELGNRRDCNKAMQCFQFAISRERNRNQLGKLASSMISTLGRLGQIDLARTVFDNAVSDGYGNTVYAYSALISAYAKSGYSDDAMRVFDTMKCSGLKPNLVTFNALIDACGKGGVNYKRALDIFNEMLENGVQPDRITYNSLLAVYGGAGMWEDAKKLFEDMVCQGIDPDIYTYNTLLDAACGGGHMDDAFKIMAKMPAKNVLPNQVTYSTMIRGCAKAKKTNRALGLFNEMKFAGIKLDRVAYNTLLGIYASLGRFDEALHVGKDMENIGIKKDVVTYNALLDGFGKQGMYNRVKELFAEMKKEHLPPNLLTYSTLINVYCKGDLYQDAMEVYREFKRQGLRADVVFYSKLIDTLCKKGLGELSALLLEEMMREGIKPNVVTYNSIINAFGQSSPAAPPAVGNHLLDTQTGSSSKQQIFLPREGSFSNGVHHEKGNEDGIVEIFRQLACGKSGEMSEHKVGTKDFRCISSVVRKMRDMEIKPNVVTFSAILNACSRCNSFEEASLLLKELSRFDNKVYGVAHGLLMADNENTWSQAVQLFDEVKRMDSSTASAFYNGLTDMLWHFGQKRGAQLVVLEGKQREVWESTWSVSCLDLHLMSSGAAQAMVHSWLLYIQSIVYDGHELPNLLSILTGWGKHSKVIGDGALKRTVEALLINIGAPFRVASCNIGRFISTGAVVTSWLRESGTLKLLVLQDARTNRSSNLQSISLYY